MIQSKPWLLVGVLIVSLTCRAAARADLVTFSDGGAYSLSTASSNYYAVSNGSTFHVLTGASVTGPSNSGGTITGAAVAITGGNLNVDGGTLTGGANSSSAGAYGFLANGTTVSTTISGGQFTGGNGTTGGDGGGVFQSAVTTISGGTFTGGNSTLNEGQGGIGFLASNYAQLSITGGVFSGGTSPGIVPIASASLAVSANGTVEISGGQFLTEINILALLNPNARVDFFGTNLNYTNSILTGTLNDGHSIDQLVNILFTPHNVVINSSHTEFSILPGVGMVPEPHSILLTVLGLGGAGWISWWRRGQGRSGISRRSG